MASSGSPPLKLLAAQWIVTHRPCRARTRVPVPSQSHLSWDRSLTWVAQDHAGTGGVGILSADDGDGDCQGAAESPRDTYRRAARRRQEEMTEPGEEEVDVLLELLPLPIPFPEREVVGSERTRGLSRAVRSRVKRRVGWQGWANAGVRSMDEICDKTATSEAGSRPSAMHLSSLSRICDALQFHRGSLQSALRFCAWLHWKWCQTGYLQRGSRFLARPRREDGRWLCSLDWLGLRSLEGLAPGVASIAKRAA